MLKSKLSVRALPMRNWIILLGLAAAMIASSASARTLTTAYGEVEVEGDPERVVTLYEGALDASLAAGITPLGAVTTRGGDGVANYIEAHLGDERPAIMGVVREINMEAVVAQRPDLILAAPRLPEKQYELLSRIAPTIVPVYSGISRDSWEAEARLYGQALNREAAIEAAITEVDQRASELAEGLSEAGVDGTAYLVRWMPAGPLVMSKQIFTSGIMARAGLDVEDAGLLNDRGVHSDPLSLENLSKVDGDWMFLATLNEDGDKALENARRNSAFTRLNVVQNERVVPVDGQLWTSANGPLAAQAIMNDIEAALLP